MPVNSTEIVHLLTEIARVQAQIKRLKKSNGRLVIAGVQAQIKQLKKSNQLLEIAIGKVSVGKPLDAGSSPETRQPHPPAGS